MMQPQSFPVQAPMPGWLLSSMLCDGLGGQEDELEDVGKGKLQPPTPASDLDPSNLDEAPVYEEVGESAEQAPSEGESAGQAPDADKLRQMEEKFARTVNIDKPLN